MKQYIIVIILALCLASCGQHSKHWETLTQVESFMEERPDSALAILQGIEVGNLSGKGEKAKHALLLSMALDKNVIDKTDFEVLQPAIDYYEDNGTPTDKLRTLYYQGRIYQNLGNEAEAMNCFLNALDEGQESNDILTKARIYVAQGKVYISLFEWDKHCDVNLKAAELFKSAGLQNSYFGCLLRALNGFTQKGDKTEAEKCIQKCKENLSVVSLPRIGDFYAAYLTYLVSEGTDSEISQAIDEYRSLIPDERLNYLSLAHAYLSVNDNEKALHFISKQTDLSNDIAQTKYYAILSEIYENLEDYQNALVNWKKYNSFSDAQIYAVFQQDTQFSEERHALEMQKAKETEAKNRLTIIMLACVIALMMSLYILNFIRKRLKETKRKNIQLESEKAHYEKMYMEVLSERNALNDMIADSTIKDETMEIIKKRLGVLNTIIVSHLSEKNTDVKRANEELEKLISDRNDFIKSTRLTLEENYPHFFTYLQDKGLDDFEIDFCCLYAIGMKGKEIKSYTNLSRHYKDSSEVRQKLGLVESDTNLSNFLQKLLKNGEE